MNLNPSVSVVIPAFNAAKFIHKTLDSVRSQIYKDYEIIVVDDGSCDNTKDIVDQYFENYELKGVCIKQHNKGIAGARNTGINKAKGEFIALLDHDDIWYPLKLQKTIEQFRRNPQAGLVGHHLMMVKDGKSIGILKNGPASKKMYESILFCSHGSMLSSTAAVFKKEKAEEVGGFRENPEFNTSEDYDFWLRLSKVTGFYFINEVLGEYTIIGSGASKNAIYHCKSVEAVLSEHFANYLGSNPGMIQEIRIRRRYANLYRSILYSLIKQKAPQAIQKEFIHKMNKNYPLSPKNIIVTILWLLKRYIRK